MLMRKLLPVILLALSVNSYAQFTTGNLVVYRVGTGAGSLVNTGHSLASGECKKRIIHTPKPVLWTSQTAIDCFFIVKSRFLTTFGTG